MRSNFADSFGLLYLFRISTEFSVSSVSDFTLVSADSALKQQRSDGSFPAGHNGPYFDEETPVRCTAHFLCLLSKAFKLTGRQEYNIACASAIDYLRSKSARPYGKTYYCRQKEGKDRCNGLVGQAWVIEALVTAADAFDREDCYQLAEEIFLLHPWVDKVSLWNRVDIDGVVLQVDQTFNHQLWFAMAGSMLHKSPNVQLRVKAFLANIVAHVELYDDGVIFHKSNMQSVFNVWSLGLRAALSKIKFQIFKSRIKKEQLSKSIGYHGFNLHALAILKKNLPDEGIWSSDLVAKLLKACEARSFVSQLSSSVYGYYYNVSGFEIALAYESFFADKVKSQEWINRQVGHTLDAGTSTLTNNVKDVNTALARIYIATYFENNYRIDL